MPAQVGEHSGHVGGQTHVRGSVAQAGKLLFAQLEIDRRGCPGAGPACPQQIPESLGADGLDRQTQQEAVEESFPDLVLGHRIGRADDADQGAALTPRPVVELPLVQERQQRIEDGAVGLEHLVDERDGGVRQEARGMPLVPILLQGLDRQRTEELLGHREAGQQAFEVPGVAKGEMKPPRELALRGPRRPDHEAMLASERRQQSEANRLLALDEPPLEGVEQTPQPG